MKDNPKYWRNDAYAKVTGKAKYTDDIKQYDMLYGVPVYSDFVHAKILDIKTEKAQQATGVVRVLTCKDVPGTNRYGQIIKDFRIFADDKIRYNGDVVALIVASSRELALEASRLVEVTAEEISPVLDAEEAMKNEVFVHENHGTNVINHHKIRRGNVEEGFKQSDIIIEEKFETQFVEHAYMETEAAVCTLRQDGVMEVYGSMQHPFSTRRFVAAVLGVDLSEVEVIGTPMGGGFGGKDDTAAIICARAALAAKITGKPVKISYRRDWSVRESYKRHPYKVYYKMGLSRDGKINAVRCKIIADGGAYCSVTPWVTWRSTVQCCGPYVVDNVHCDTYGVYTNNVVTGAMRGFGSPQMNFVIESVMEIAASKLKISSIGLRKKNVVRQNSTTITGQVLNNHIVSMEQVLDTLIENFDYFNKYRKCSFGKSDSDELYGVGLAMCYRGMSIGAEGVDFNSAIINVQKDGSVLLETGIHENGQGAESAMILCLSGELGIPKEKIRYRRPSTSTIPDGGTTVASRGTLLGTSAVVNAAKILKEKITDVIGNILNSGADKNLIFKDGKILGIDGKSITFEEAISVMYEKRVYPYSFGVFTPPMIDWNEETGQGNPYFTYVYGAQAIELIVNKKTGKVKLLNAVAVHDVGKEINPGMLRGQFYGGMAMGIGYGLFEKIKIKNGRIENLNLTSYHVPRSVDLPEMKALIVENNDPTSTSGAKGIGEPANELMAPAVANAIYNATGIRYYKLPVMFEGDKNIKDSVNKK
ncbi:MAG: xanthine dehydrogenase family protein [Ignavibacteria bacterium]|nr:xanthine dehydrogenase family protein [Ignavibacteria bacterium]